MTSTLLPSSAPKTSAGWRSAAPPLAIALAGLCAYQNCFQGAFVFDDFPTIVNNPAIRHLWRWGKPASAEAIAQFQEAVRLKPAYAGAHNNLGNLLARSGRPVEALAQFNEALRLNPDLAGARTNLGIALAQSGHLAEAAPHFAEAVRLEPAHLA